MTKTSFYDNALNAQMSKEAALIEAKKQLSAKGIYYPSFDPKTATIDFYDAAKRYSEMESSLVAQLLSVIPSPVGKVIDKAPPKWNRPYYDD